MDIIKSEIQIIRSEKLPKLDIKKLQRDVLEKEIRDNFFCGSSMSSIFRIISQIISDFSKGDTVSPEIANWLTDLTRVGGNTVESVAFKGGIRYVSDTILIKVSQQKDDPSLIHEFFIGLHLNKLRDEIPNFMYVLGIFSCNYPNIISAENENFKIEKLCSSSGSTVYLIAEMIPGKNLASYINEHKFSLEDLINITLQLLFALQKAQNDYEYCHYDLRVTNIMIRKTREKISFNYMINGQNHWITTDKIAAIIDYGFSRITVNGVNYGIQNKPDFGIDNTFKPGIDIFVFFQSLFTTLVTSNSLLAPEYISIFRPFLFSHSNALTQNYLSDRAISTFNPQINNYSYPAKGDQGIYNLKPVDVLVYIYQTRRTLIDKIITLEIPSGSISQKNCPDREIVQNKLLTPKLEKSCSGDPWKTLTGHWKDQFGRERYWFDCGVFSFDGRFNVVSFPKGMTLYHGSAPLAYYGAEYPLGIDYYKTKFSPLNKEEKEELKNPQISTRRKNEILKKHLPINLGYYGDMEVAMAYSSIAAKVDDKDGEFELNCGINCISAYKLKKEIIMIDLYDPFNIYILLQNYLSPDAKQILVDQYDLHPEDFVDLYEKIIPPTQRESGKIDYSEDQFQKLQQAYNPFRRFLLRSTRGTLRRRNYLVPKEILKIAFEYGYSGFVNPRTPYIKGSEVGRYRFGEFVFGDNVSDFVARDYENPHDWQYFNSKRLFGEIGKLVKSMYKYKTDNIDFHAGDLYEHSIWTALYLQQAFKEKSPWVEGIPDYLTSLLVISAFLHDIGKGGDLVYSFYDKPRHPRIGFEYWMQIRPYLYVDPKDTQKILDIPSLLQNTNVHREYQSFVGFIILAHWEFGDFIRRLTETNVDKIANEYIEKVTEMSIEAGTINIFSLPVLLRCIMLVSVCDIMAGQVYIPSEKFREISQKIKVDSSEVFNDLNAKLEPYPYLTNRSKNHRGGAKYEDFNIVEKGLYLRKAILSMVDIEQMEIV